MKFNLKSVLLVGTSLLATVPSLALADANAVSALKSAIGERTLGCQVHESGRYRPAPPFIELSVVKSTHTGNDVIFATARYDGAKYGVDSDKIVNNVLVIPMSNDVDGPHSEDKLEIPLAELNRLKADPNGKIQGSDHYSEDWNGTSTVLRMTCELE